MEEIENVTNHKKNGFNKAFSVESVGKTEDRSKKRLISGFTFLSIILVNPCIF
jgi:hypothetical protein